MDKTAPRRQRLAATIEHQTGKGDRFRVFSGKQCRSAGQDETGLLAHAKKLGAVRQFEIADLVVAGRQPQRRARACRLVDGMSQAGTLVVGRTRANAVTRDVAAGYRRRRCGGCRRRQSGSAGQ